MDGNNATVTLDFSKLSSRMEELHDALLGRGKTGDAATVFRDEARLFVKQVIRLTPPKTQKQGEAAIDRDMMKLFEPVNGDFLDDMIIEHGANNLDTWLTTAGGEKKHLKWTYLDNTGGPMANFHHQHQDSRGRANNMKRQNDPSTWYAPYVVSYENFTAYSKKIKSHVGRRKAAWAKSFKGLGGTVSRWIDRHTAGAKGEFHMSQDPNHPSITMINRAPGIGQDLNVVRSALRVRQEAISRRIKLVLSGYSRDMARGMKIQRQAHKTPGSEAE
jgi:hypothetical protein